MRNFPKGFRKELKQFVDSRGVQLSDRLRRLNQAIDDVWLRPFDPEVVERANRRMAKFLRGINRNTICKQRFELKAQYVQPFNAKAENDSRQAIILDEGHLKATLDAATPLFDQPITADGRGRIIKGLGALVLNFFVISLYREVSHFDPDSEDAVFTAPLIERLKEIVAKNTVAWAPGTALPERLKAVEIVMHAAALNPDNKDNVTHLCQLLGRLEMPELVPPQVTDRIRMCELYHRAWPYVMGKHVFRHESIEHQGMIKRDIERLMEKVRERHAAIDNESDVDRSIRVKIESRLARAIGVSNDDLGWEIYRGMRQGVGGARLRTEYLFQELLSGERDRLAVVNVIYQHKKRDLHPTDPNFKKAHEIIIAKYQPFFEKRLIMDFERNVICLPSTLL